MYTEISYDDKEFGEYLEIAKDRYYSMFTIEGNEYVAKLVDKAQSSKHSWNKVLKELRNLAKKPGLGEATDTAVRESVYIKLGFAD